MLDEKIVYREMAKNHSPDFQASNFSVINTSHSQVLGTADSLSLPSEPPDIRNWFSSYVYESPELNTDYEFEGYGFREIGCLQEGFGGEEKSNEKEKNLGDLKKIRYNNGLVMADASIGFVKSNNIVEDDNCANKHASQVLGSFDSFPLSSEPADITTWFSSYVYESPVLDTSDDLRGFVITESECDRVPCHAENCSKEHGENLTEFRRTPIRDELAVDKKIASIGLIKCYSSDMDKNHDCQDNTEDIHGVERNKMLSFLNDLPVKMISGQVLRGKLTRNSNFDQKIVEKTILNGQVSIGKRGRSRELDSMPLNTSSSLDRNNKKISGKINFDRENNGKIFLKNGFISTGNNKSARPNDDGSLKRSMEAAVSGRGPLLERINVQQISSSEIIGKWQCPQKRKSKLGPPLKQLRLERWVRRV